MNKGSIWKYAVLLTGVLLITGCMARAKPSVRVNAKPSTEVDSETYVRVDSEPRGASVYWEGKDVGQTPVLVGEVGPEGNVYEVKLSKQNYKDYTKLFRVEPATRPGKRTLELFVQMEPATVDLSLYDTNTNLLEKAIQNLLQIDKVASLTARGGSIAVVNIVSGEDSPSSRTESLIENTLINFLTRNGYQVVERDASVLIQIVHEASGNLSYTIMTKHEGPEKPFVYDARIDADKTDGVNLPTADYILAYTVMENGVMYTQPEPQNYRYPSKPSESGDIIEEPITKRNARVKLHMRLINVKAGAVIWSDTLEGTATDVIPTRFKARLENPVFFIK